MTTWPVNPKCKRCGVQPCGTYHASKDGEWLSLCCSAPVGVRKVAAA